MDWAVALRTPQDTLAIVDVASYVCRSPPIRNIDISRPQSWCRTKATDPIAAKADEIVGGFISIPRKTSFVLAVDVKSPRIQGLERRQGYLKLQRGRALTGKATDYKRPGPPRLFRGLHVETAGHSLGAALKRPAQDSSSSNS